jgi:hypothetical protein
VFTIQSSPYFPVACGDGVADGDVADGVLDVVSGADEPVAEFRPAGVVDKEVVGPLPCAAPVFLL